MLLSCMYYFVWLLQTCFHQFTVTLHICLTMDDIHVVRCQNQHLGKLTDNLNKMTPSSVKVCKWMSKIMH